MTRAIAGPLISKDGGRTWQAYFDILLVKAQTS
jgi:hypothetical protein